MSGKWLKLSGELYLFGENSINRVVDYAQFLDSGKKSDWITALYNKTSLVAVVKEPLEKIEEMLKDGK